MKTWQTTVLKLKTAKEKLKISNYRLAKEIKVSESTIKRMFDLQTIPKLDLVVKTENYLNSLK